MRYKNVNLMSRAQKRRESVGCFGQIENIKRQSLAYQNWINDGNPTGIESGEQFYDLQRQAYGEVVIELEWL